MATATRVQTWTYGALLLLDTLLATLLGTALAEAASIASSRRDSGECSSNLGFLPPLRSLLTFIPVHITFARALLISRQTEPALPPRRWLLLQPRDIRLPAHVVSPPHSSADCASVGANPFRHGCTSRYAFRS